MRIDLKPLIHQGSAQAIGLVCALSKNQGSSDTSCGALVGLPSNVKCLQ